jgi:hypothetical protein
VIAIRDSVIADRDIVYVYSIVQAVTRVQVTRMMNWTKSVKSEI